MGHCRNFPVDAFGLDAVHYHRLRMSAKIRARSDFEYGRRGPDEGFEWEMKKVAGGMEQSPCFNIGRQIRSFIGKK